MIDSRPGTFEKDGNVSIRRTSISHVDGGDPHYHASASTVNCDHLRCPWHHLRAISARTRLDCLRVPVGWQLLGGVGRHLGPVDGQGGRRLGPQTRRRPCAGILHCWPKIPIPGTLGEVTVTRNTRVDNCATLPNLQDITSKAMPSWIDGQYHKRIAWRPGRTCIGAECDCQRWVHHNGNPESGTARSNCHSQDFRRDTTLLPAFEARRALQSPSADYSRIILSLPFL